MKLEYPIRQRFYKSLTCLLLVVFVSISFAAEFHKTDIEKAHHTHHDCNLFAHVVCAIKPHIATLPIIVSHDYVEPIDQVRTVTRTFYKYCVRSPPQLRLS
ncbi:DUF2607 family protein [Vibrio viridaestus]|uniref:DUF2607 family protein n=1 Tax=Vibrio viridaestus TaxID=2487322 RepID=A0A3N9TC42_9VIBR|nr:DUF2607 family protein [Vibrio viridaestus]